MIFKDRPPRQPPPLFLAPQVVAEVHRLLRERKKINAIKVVREHTRCGLAEAKDLVDAMEGGYVPPAGPQQGVPPRGYAQPGFAPQGYPPVPQPGGPSLADRARAFRDSGDADRAAALVQAETGMTRAEAERFVTALG